jgi:putative glutamine amidotransferase
LIGIASPKKFLEGKMVEQYFCVSSGYVDGIARAGGTPFILPLMTIPDAPYRRMVEALDGIILTGGEDPSPHLYGEAPQHGLGEVAYERDLAELALIRLAVELKKPILGICRGMQILNVALGGTLIQDIPRQVPGSYQHAQKGSKQYGTHTVRLEPGFLASAFGQTEVFVNSSHHQAVKDPAPGFTVTGRAGDGVIEAIESENGLMIGVQWHPERMWGHDGTMQKLAAAFVDLAARKQLNNR